MDHSHHQMNHAGCHGAPAASQAHDHAGHGVDKHAGHHTADFLTKFWVVLVLTVPILAYSDIVEMVLGWRAPRFAGDRYLVLALASTIFFYGGGVFLVGAYRELKARLPGMMTLIAIAISAAYIFSVYVTFAGGMDLFWELATLIAIMLLGHWVEMKAVVATSGALKELAKLLPDKAEVERDGQVQIIALAELRVGDVVVVRPGAQVPADGVIIGGQSELNEAVITGESRPVDKKAGDSVIAGSINGDGGLRVRVDKIGEQTFLSGVMRLVAEAESSKSRLQILSDRAAMYLTFLAVGAGGVTLAAWLSVGAGVAMSVERLVAVLVIACPHALGLAVPMVASISTTMAARNGFLVKRRLALEAARSIDTVLFDKTGTLTRGEFGVTDVLPFGGNNKNQVIGLAAGVNQFSEHPLAKAMVAMAKQENLNLSKADDFKRLPGQGAEAMIEGEKIVVGNESVVPADALATIALADREKLLALAKTGKTVIYVVRTGALVGAMALADLVRDEAREAIKALTDRGIKVAMITGDSVEVAKWVAGELGITEYFASVRPGEKSAKVKLLQGGGAKVAMVGDGVNDAPALTQADLGIAIGAGTNVAIESAGIILAKNDPRDIPKIIRLSQLTYGKMIQNLWWASGYNILALPLAAGALYSKGIVLQPAVAAVFMSASTVIVAINAVLLKRKAL